MPRRSGDLAAHATRRAPKKDETSRPGELSPEKRRIAEALAALLVAHYRRQGERPERVPQP